VTRFRVLRGGRLSDEELAAVAVALTPVVGQEPSPPDDATLSGWQQAALREGTGARPLVSPTDLALLLAGEEAAGPLG
jgi:hypothetical protein